MHRVMTVPPYSSFADELENFQEIARALKPTSGELPRLDGIDMAGVSMALGNEIGGDHLIYIDFARRFDLGRRLAVAEAEGHDEVAAALRRGFDRAGILVADVSGHRVTDGLVAAMLHQSFLLGAYYELDRFGEITTKLFEHINQRFYQSTRVNKYLTMLYGEISSEGRFRFISAGHPAPRVFSRRLGCFVDIHPDRLVSFPPVGMFPSDADPDERVAPSPLGYKELYQVNEIDLLGFKDVLLLHTDGLSEHGDGEYFPGRVEALLAEVGDLPAATIAERLREDLLEFAAPEDDISFVVVRRVGRRV